MRSSLLTSAGFLQLQQIKQLVNGAQAGDHFFFHCASSSRESLPRTCRDHVLKMQDIQFKSRIQITAKKMAWMNVGALL